MQLKSFLRKCLFWSYRKVLCYAKVTFLKNAAQIEIMEIEHKIPIYNNAFPGVRGLISSYIVCDYTTSGYTDL